MTENFSQKSSKKSKNPDYEMKYMNNIDDIMDKDIDEQLDNLGMQQNSQVKNIVDHLVKKTKKKTEQQSENGQKNEEDIFKENDEFDDEDEFNQEKNEDEEEEESSYDENDFAYKQEDLIFNPESQLRKWLKSRGKTHCIDFTDEQLKQLRTYFDSLDSQSIGSIGADELEDPLIALGLVDNRQQVNKIVEMVDDDGSGVLEFGEFLNIIKGGSNAKESTKDDGTGAIYKFFKDLTNGNMKIEGNENIPFSLLISTQRRRKIIDSMMSKNPQAKKEGEKILQNYKKQKAEKLFRDHLQITGNFSSPQSSNYNSKSKLNASDSVSKQKQLQIQKEKELEQQKLIQQKLQEISSFKGQPPEPEDIMKILRQKSNFK